MVRSVNQFWKIVVEVKAGAKLAKGARPGTEFQQENCPCREVGGQPWKSLCLNWPG